jgi:hypothetical protein
VNHRLGRRRDGGYYVKPEVKAWEDEYMWLLKRIDFEGWNLPLEVTCSATFTSEHRACDLVNFQKIVLDPIQTVTGINDKDMRWRDGERTIDKKQLPHLLITITESSLTTPVTHLKSIPEGIRGQTGKILRGKKNKSK